MEERLPILNQPTSEVSLGHWPWHRSSLTWLVSGLC
ncbi:adipose differentiation related protein, isoform CRA_e [Mus musculus]|nr:adipose differentiation related protein, isoform CRA_e [Mus musculus]